MRVPGVPDRLVVLFIGVSVLFFPIILLTLTLGFLVFVGDLSFARLSPLELLELYVLELAASAAFAYGLYRLTRRFVTHTLPASLDAVREADSEDATDTTETRE